MIKKTITYKDFNDEERTEDFYFHLSPAEIVEIEAGVKGGLMKAMQDAVSRGDTATIMQQVKRIILLAYGKKSEDGRKFLKNEALREDFESTNAYSALFMEMVTNADSVAAFIKGIIPQDLAKQAAELAGSNGAAGPQLVHEAPAEAEPGRSVVPQRVNRTTLHEMDADAFERTMKRVAKGEVEIVG